MEKETKTSKVNEIPVGSQPKGSEKISRNLRRSRNPSKLSVGSMLSTASQLTSSVAVHDIGRFMRRITDSGRR